MTDWDEVRDILNRIEGERRLMMGWLPITTAPYGVQIVVGHWDGAEWRSFFEILDPPGDGRKATHWHPLSEPPA